ncbi:unnamed protein product [Enterobius vermicularis]|uniref:Solute carrier family 25 member 38 n=1 Tax=Enterobius vermicularis TaxID=51028 RepID=A0A0N4VL24_ENTVE|nr:unnamed protein product [Enterobius vermicularis]
MMDDFGNLLTSSTASLCLIRFKKHTVLEPCYAHDSCASEKKCLMTYGKPENSQARIITRKQSTVQSVLTSAQYGSLSSLCSTLILQPLDRLKTLSQQDTGRRVSAFTNARLVVQRHGVIDLWRGSVPTILRVVPGVALYFGFLELGQKYIAQSEHPLTENFLLGFVSRSFVAVTLMPATVIKTRFESNIYRDESIYGAVKRIMKSDGFQGLFKGVIPTVLRDAPFSGIYLAFYRQNKKLWEKHFGQVKALTRFFCGIMAGVFACAVTQPFDVTKTQMQLYPNRFSSSLQVVRSIHKTGGWLAFFKGFILRSSRRTAMAALSWTIFDEASSFVG